MPHAIHLRLGAMPSGRLSAFPRAVRAALVLLCPALLVVLLSDVGENPPFTGGTLTGSGKIPAIEFYYLSRLAGSGDVNVDREHLRATVLARAGNALGKRTAGPRWTSLGPASVPGRVRAFAFHPSDTNRIYAGTASGGVFGSIDGGASWNPLTDDMPALSVGAVEVDPSRPETMYAGTGEPIVPLSRAISAPSFTGVGVLKSDDGGASWNTLPWPAAASAISRILVHPTATDTVLAATRNGILRSPDRGASWEEPLLAGVVSDMRFREGDPSTIVAALGDDYGESDNGIYISNAGGRRFSWRKLDRNFPAPDSVGRIVLATTPADPALLLALIASPVNRGNDFFILMRSMDFGETWERLPQALPPNFALQQAHYNLCLAVSPLDARLVYAGGLEVWRSVNGGSAFARLTFGGQSVHVDQHVIAFQPGSGAIFLGNDGGVYRSASLGDRWEFTGRSLENAQFYSVAADPRIPGRIFGGTQDNGSLRYVAGGFREWNALRGDGDGGNIVVDSNLIYTLITLLPYPYRTADGGQIWSQLNRGIGAADRHAWLQPLLLHPRDRSRLYTATQYVYVAANVNAVPEVPEWKLISPDLTHGNRTESVISALAIPPSNPDRMYAGTGDGRVQVCTGLGSAVPSWRNVPSGLPGRWVTDIEVDPLDDFLATAAFSGFGGGHVFRTSDGGDSWTDISGNLPDVPVNAILSTGIGGRTLFAASDIGVWHTSDGGATWSLFGDGLPNVVVYALSRDAEGHLLAATHGRGMWRTEVALATGPEPKAVSAVGSVYPNPVRGGSGAECFLEVTSGMPAPATLEWYDLAGKLVRRIRRERLGPGKDAIRTPLGDLPPGVYLYRLEAGTIRAAGKIILFPL